MSPRDFAILVLICAAWAMNTIVTKIVVTDGAIPPMIFAAARFTVVLAAVFPWLRPVPRPLGRVIVVGVLMGAGGFGLAFLGMRDASPSAAGVVTQLGVPMMVLLSVVMLGERLDARRAIGSAVAVGGGLLVMWDPHGPPLQVGLLFIAAGAFCTALGSILMKRIDRIGALRFQAWVALSSLPVMLAASLLFEHGQVAAIRSGLGYFVGGMLFNGLVVSVMAHTAYYWLIRRYDMSLLAPLTLINPVLIVVFGVWLTHDRFGPRLALGVAATLVGVLIIGVQPSRLLALFARVGSRRT